MKRILIAACAAVVCAAVLLGIAGCGGSAPSTGATDPQGAVKSFLDAVASKNWNNYQGSILPENIKALPDDQLARLKGQLESTADAPKFTGLTMSTEFDPKDKTTARVTMTGGTVTLAASGSTPAQSQKVADMPQADRVIYVKEYKGHWYIDMAAMSALQQETQPSSTTPAPPSTTP